MDPSRPTFWLPRFPGELGGVSKGFQVLYVKAYYFRIKGPAAVMQDDLVEHRRHCGQVIQRSRDRVIPLTTPVTLPFQLGDSHERDSIASLLRCRYSDEMGKRICLQKGQQERLELPKRAGIWSSQHRTHSHPGHHTGTEIICEMVQKGSRVDTTYILNSDLYLFISEE